MNEETDELNQQGASGRPVSVLDPDFLLFALPLAIVIDALDWVVEVGTVLDLVAGWTLVPWLMWRTGGTSGAPTQKIKGAAQKTPEQLAKQATRKALFRGILAFILELVPIVNLVPWWTYRVVSTLWQKGDAQPQAQNALAQEGAAA